MRDTVAGDYLSGVSRGVEAVIAAVAIAAGIGFVLSMSIGISGGM
ncbi:MAG: threonine/serine exporter family protein [Longicatena sp.]